VNHEKLKIAIILIDRANYGRMKPVMEEMLHSERIELQVICAGTMLLGRFGRAVDIVIEDGFIVNERVYMEIEGSVPISMAKSIGLGIIEFSTALQRLDPDFVVLIGDRYEALGAAIATVFQNKCLIHLQGGEVTGTIDESTRHAISKLAHYHFPATKRSGEYLINMGEKPETVFPFGCPSADVVTNSLKEIPRDSLQKLGVGVNVDFSKPYLLVLFHPVTTEFSHAEQQMEELLAALKETNEQVVLLWPNIDAGSDKVSKAIRRFRENNRDYPLHAYKNFEPEVYIPLLSNASCAIGNSSSFVRDASFLGTPIVLVGSRQDGREWSEAVRRVEPVHSEILAAIKAQLIHGRYPISNLYGQQGVSKMIVDQILMLKPYSQKHLDYIYR
jgi:UDP-hydrolysing UDP-N-acetyl-D-glucosamine 2-epimerase